MARDAFGERLAADTLIFDNFAYTEPVMHHYYAATPIPTVRCNADVGEVASFDPATAERSELDTLDRASGSSPLLNTDPNRTLSFDFFIPADHYQPGGSSAFVLAQIVVTGYGPPAQIHYNTTGTLRLRSLIAGSFQHTVLADIADVKDRWVPLSIAGIWSKSAATAQTVVTLDGQEVYSLTGAENVGATAADLSKVYGKVGPYRTAVDTDPNRGIGDIWYRNLSYAA